MLRAMTDMPSETPETPAAELDYVFGDFRLSPGEMVLRRDGADLGLNRRSVEVLLHLVRSPGRGISREDFVGSLWAGGPAGAGNRLETCIRRLRSVLEHGGGEPEFIETLPEPRYRFLAEVTRQPPVERVPARPPLLSPALQFAGMGGVIALILLTLVARSVFFTPSTAELYPDQALAQGPSVQTHGAYTVTDEGAQTSCVLEEGVLACTSEGPGRVTFAQGEDVIGAIAVATGRRVSCELAGREMRCDR